MLGKRGANVVVNHVSPGSAERAEQTAQAIRDAGAKAVVCQANVSELADMPKLIDAALKLSETGKIEILIHK